MRILVISDSHGMPSHIMEAVELHPEADALIFLGDGEHDLEMIENCCDIPQIVKVAGNCDFSSRLPLCRIITLGGKKIYCTHGHSEHVKHGVDELLCCARREDADIVLYGHTHAVVTDYEDGLYIMNPGSIRDGNYGLIDIVPGGVMLNAARL
ncbi:MAG: metallophosphoesterase family protein [Acutalibacteraceae bacterium]